MKKVAVVVLHFAQILSSCTGIDHKETTGNDNRQSEPADERGQIIELVKRMYNWHETYSSKNDLVCLTDARHSVYIGIDLEKQKMRSAELRNSGFFSDEFIANDYKISEEIDRKLRNKEYGEEWMVGYLPPFGPDANAWCNCQDYPYDNPWDKIEIKFNSLDDRHSTITWTWGESEWSKNFEYEVRLSKVDGTWKISYLEGFDFDNFTRKNY